MFDKTTISKLKRTNISQDKERTVQHVYKIWKNASPEEKKTVETLAGMARASVQRVYKTGSISAKLAVPFAQTFGVNPFYLIGEADESGECSDELLVEFMKRFGYEELLPKKRTKARGALRRSAKAAKAAKAEELESIPAEKSTEEHSEEPKEDSCCCEALPEAKEPDGSVAMTEAKEPDGSVEMTEAKEPDGSVEMTEAKELDGSVEMTEDEMVLLMRSIMLKARFGGDTQKAEKLKRLLLS